MIEYTKKKKKKSSIYVYCDYPSCENPANATVCTVVTNCKTSRCKKKKSEETDFGDNCRIYRKKKKQIITGAIKTYRKYILRFKRWPKVYYLTVSPRRVCKTNFFFLFFFFNRAIQESIRWKPAFETFYRHRSLFGSQYFCNYPGDA